MDGFAVALDICDNITRIMVIRGTNPDSQIWPKS
jgi:hypothetical protein